MDKDQIKTLLPHREPMLLLDMAEVTGDHAGYAEYTIKEDEFFLIDHYDGTRIVPGTILCEIMAQSCVTVAINVIHDNIPLYASMNNVKFYGVVRSGDKCQITTNLTFSRGNLYQCTITLEVNGELRCEGEFACAIVPKDTGLQQ